MSFITRSNPIINNYRTKDMSRIHQAYKDRRKDADESVEKQVLLKTLKEAQTQLIEERRLTAEWHSAYGRLRQKHGEEV